MGLDPRTKLLGVVMLLVTTFLVEQVRCLLGLSVLFVLVAFATKTSALTYLRHLLLLSWLMIVTFCIHVWARDAGHGADTFLADGVRRGFIAVGQLSVAVGWISILHRISSPLELMGGLERILHPLQRIGVSVHNLSILGMLSMRFLPIVFEEGQYLLHAYTARGIEWNRGTLGRQFKNVLLLCVPLLSMLLRRVEHITCAMENRGFCVGAARSSFQEFRLRTVDYIVLGGNLGLLIGCYAINRM